MANDVAKEMQGPTLASLAAENGGEKAHELPAGWHGANVDIQSYGKPPIVVDIDDTIQDWFSIFLRSFYEMTGRQPNIDEIQDYDIAETLNVSIEELKEIVLHSHYHEAQRSNPLYPGVRKALSLWHSAGHPIMIATSRPLDVQQETASWLYAKRIPISTVAFVKDKVAYAREYNAIAIIDDRPDVLQNGPPEFLCGAIRQLWHRRGAQGVDSRHVVIADNWKELYKSLTQKICARLNES